MSEYVVLVDENDRDLQLMEKMEAHEKGLLHRAFSVFILNDQDQLMLQRRALEKYHSGGLWTNTCCSHPRDGEPVEQAAHRRLMEEMGFDCPIAKAFDFIYRAELDKGLTEHEFDHLFIGRYNGEPRINPEEVSEWRWMDVEEVRDDLNRNPDKYTAWFRIIFDRFYQNLNLQK